MHGLHLHAAQPARVEVELDIVLLGAKLRRRIVLDANLQLLLRLPLRQGAWRESKARSTYEETAAIGPSHGERALVCEGFCSSAKEA
ncbi:hypothetical protein DSM21852_10300 [Methylocystis bryophila]|nr:hypothetical protein DSM21852_10300 [Methylocystis bryophila]